MSGPGEVLLGGLAIAALLRLLSELRLRRKAPKPGELWVYWPDRGSDPFGPPRGRPKAQILEVRSGWVRWSYTFCGENRTRLRDFVSWYAKDEQEPQR